MDVVQYQVLGCINQLRADIQDYSIFYFSFPSVVILVNFLFGRGGCVKEGGV